MVAALPVLAALLRLFTPFGRSSVAENAFCRFDGNCGRSIPIHLILFVPTPRKLIIRVEEKHSIRHGT